MTTEAALNLANFGFCTAIWWACVCRLNLLSSDSEWRARAMFTLVLFGATAHGLAPWFFGERAGLGSTVFSASILLGLVLTSHRWRAGAPDDLASAPGEFDDEPIRGRER